MNEHIGALEVLSLALFLFAIFAVWSSVRIVPQGYNWTIEKYGRYTRPLTPGLHIRMPFMDRVSDRINMKEQVIDIPSQVVGTRDIAPIA